MRRLAAAVLLAGALIGGEAATHAMPNSTVQLAPDVRGLRATITIPLTELEAALGRRPRDDDAALGAYLREHVIVRSGARDWPQEVVSMKVDAGDHPAVVATLAFARPEGANDAELRYDAVTHRIASHYVLVYWQGHPLARLQLPQKSTAIPLRSQSP